jgi:hypothetical protein
MQDDEDNDRLHFINVLKELKIKTIIYTVNDGAEFMKNLQNENNILRPTFFS